MEPNDQPLLLNLGSGECPVPGYVNVDLYGNPDVVWDLQKFPYPWDDNTVDEIVMHHVLEHLPDWWSAFLECARILKPGGQLHIHVPDESSPSALTYRDHHHVFSSISFHGIQYGRGGGKGGANSWAVEVEQTVPLTMYDYKRVPYSKYNWMRWVPGLLPFVADHMRGFIWGQEFHFRKIGEQK
jgi:SAM-dependent methyltransferase